MVRVVVAVLLIGILIEFGALFTGFNLPPNFAAYVLFGCGAAFALKALWHVCTGPA